VLLEVEALRRRLVWHGNDEIFFPAVCGYGEVIPFTRSVTIGFLRYFEYFHTIIILTACNLLEQTWS
jgi:hypothetical protein